MKKTIATITMIIMLIAMTSGLVYAGTTIQQSDIKEGLTFCELYPVKLALDGKEISFLQKDVPPVIIKERTLIPARALFEAMGGKVTWNNDTQSVHVTYDDTEVVLTIGSDKALVNGQSKELEVPALIIDHDNDYYGSTMIPVRFTAEALGCNVGWEDATRSVVIASPAKPEIPIIDSKDGDNNQNGNTGNDWDTSTTWQYEKLNEAAKGKLVVIDMGHGGKDSGSIGHKNMSDELSEKELNLPIGIKLNEYLKSAGVSTYVLRETDIYYTLLERAQKSNDAGATIFISIHNNSSESSAPNGTEVLYNSKSNTEGKSEMDLYGIQSKAIAQNVQNEMVKSLGTHNRGIKNSPEMAVLNKTYMPAIIVEGAFLSNESDFEMMKKADYTDKYALAVAKGIIKSLNEAYK
ncbi:N-acetylmuramoyl-L-alanine amidase [Aminipila sp.]|uniref:N-acetylmuramoyl-L-alanine amidase n=1 Tax=Aminipila sp. TaxID=2060095 RepID=UPI00289FF81C|nr:N-acetylmuramoyl-L-alanine amidase [Aminipila sp.]